MSRQNIQREVITPNYKQTWITPCMKASSAIHDSQVIDYYVIRAMFL